MAKNTRTMTEINKLNIDIRDWQDSSEAYRAERDALVKALEFIRDGSENKNFNYVDYRVKTYQVALDALALVGGSSNVG